MLQQKELQLILDIKRKLELSGIDYKNLLYCPEVPLCGINKSYVIEEVAGIKVARLISSHGI